MCGRVIHKDVVDILFEVISITGWCKRNISEVIAKIAATTTKSMIYTLTGSLRNIDTICNDGPRCYIRWYSHIMGYRLLSGVHCHTSSVIFGCFLAIYGRLSIIVWYKWHQRTRSMPSDTVCMTRYIIFVLLFDQTCPILLIIMYVYDITIWRIRRKKPS